MSDTRRPHVVAVNDDPVQLLQLSAILKGGAYEVSSFQDAAEALAALSGRPEVDLFVVDLHMPGIDGWKLCRLLRSPDFVRFNETPILLVSATFTGDDVASITEELGANGFLEAPFKSEVLLRYVQSLLSGERPRSEPRVLIVEDDDAVRSALRRTFSQHGYRVSEAATLVDAERTLANDPIDLLLLDYHLPDGTAEVLLDRLKGKAHRTCALIMTGDTHPALPVRVLARGADGYLRKPFDPAFAVELARKARRERALLRIETVLEARTRELRASEERYRSLFEAIPDLLLVVDEGSHVAAVNPDGLRYLGWDEASVVGHNVLELAGPETTRELARWLAEVGERGATHFETELRRPDGSSVPVELTGRTIEFQGHPATLLVGRDLTERRSAEEERRRLESHLQHAQRLESLGVLAGGVAHDFNNLLVGILGNASLALLDLPDETPVRDAVQQIDIAARRAAELTQQILAFAGKTKVSSHEVSLSELVSEMGQLLEPAVSKKARLTYRLPRSLPPITGDPGQVRQVVMNLIINASDALGGKPGAIEVSTSLREVGPEAPFFSVGGTQPRPGRYVALQIRDEGCGMDEATRHRIFEPFFTTKFTGRGLGLASTLGIVRAHHGHISVESSPNRGTTVTVLFPPRQGGRGGPGPRPEGGERWWTDGGHAVIVDDEPAVRGLARATLQRHGFTVDMAGNGAEGVELVRDLGTRATVVVMDFTMPELDGMEALAALRATHPHLPVLLSSGYPKEGMLDDVDGGEPTAFLKKPYSPSDLMQAVSDLLAGSRGPLRSAG